MAQFQSCCSSKYVKAEEVEIRDHCCASCIVRYPCLCCWASLVLAILASVLGMMFMIMANQDSSAGPLRSTDGGLTYPITNNIAMQMDALYLSAQASEDVWDNYVRGRRLEEQPGLNSSRSEHVARSSQQMPPEPLTSFALAALPDSAGGQVTRELLRREAAAKRSEKLLLPRSARRAGRAPAGDPELGELPTTAGERVHRNLQARALQSGGPQWQEEHLLSALFIFNSRRSSNNVFDDAGLAEMCALHATFTGDATRSGSYAGYPDFCVRRWDGSNAYSCHTGLTPLVFFYGDASYDIDTLDTSAASRPAFGAVATAVLEHNVSYALAQYPAETAAVALLVQLGSYFPHWLDSTAIQRSPFVCNPAHKKDTAAVMRVMALIRETPELSERFGGIINYYFDSGMTSTNLRSVYTRATYGHSPDPSDHVWPHSSDPGLPSESTVPRGPEWQVRLRRAAALWDAAVCQLRGSALRAGGQFCRLVLALRQATEGV